ncbi:probable endonuclease 4 isoform X3 [Pseudophryne corroboree]|uniref:probable endonuclease 4 isoform X3 n=1 Tax=Pseudophryne corroboree TaxID=495146 RepID=UPI003081AFB8
MEEQGEDATSSKVQKGKRRKEKNENAGSDLVPNPGPYKKQRRKKAESVAQSQEKKSEDISANIKPDKVENAGSDLVPNPGPYKMQRRKKAETVAQSQEKKSEEISVNIKPDKGKARKQTKSMKRESRTLDGENSKAVEEEAEVSETIPNHLHHCMSSHKYVGAHLSIQGGLWKAVEEAKHIRAKAFGLFLGSQRTWNSKTLEEEAAERFRKTCSELGFEPCYILPHSPYLMNLGSPRPDVFQKSRAMLVKELNRCHQLGLTLYNIHPGSHVGAMPVNECLELIADGINNAHLQVPGVTVVLENMSCQGSTIGGRFEELRGIIDHVADKSRVGVCLDTCHAFAAGHNLSEETGLQNMLDEFDKVVGLSYLKAVHLNDSKGKVGCHLDRHENIGRGYIGLEGFRKIMNEPRFNEIPMILETPYSSEHEDYSKEIDLLYSLCAGGVQ